MAQTPKQTPKTPSTATVAQVALAKQLFGSATQKASFLKSEFRNQASTAIITAFGLVIALAWKDVITELVTKLNPANNSLLLSAIIVTFIGILGIALISKWNKNVGG
ncbi:hypothetical protein FJZ22_02835 [Candidatus Pacearchaeota archaeon]|nr:hypothetical protein [Candidatus Pacearchaeota archaeon]